MAYSVGVVLAVLVAVFGRWSRFDRDRAFYATVLIVVALVYVLFAVVGGSTRAVIVESAVMVAFAAAAVAGFRRNLWIVAAGLGLHGVFDFVHADLVRNPGVPAWWPAFCGAYDVTAAAILAWLLSSHARGIPYARGQASSAQR